jgi:hypothetical protein
MKKVIIGSTVFLCTFANMAFSQEGSDLFQFKEPEPVVQNVAPVVQNPELSEIQEKQVKDMISSLVSRLNAFKSDVENIRKVEIEGEDFALMDDGDRYVGVSSGMHVVYSVEIEDYVYHDSQIYKGVMTRSRYSALMEETNSAFMKEAMGVVENLSSSSDEASEAIIPPTQSGRIVPVKSN